LRFFGKQELTHVSLILLMTLMLVSCVNTKEQETESNSISEEIDQTNETNSELNKEDTKDKIESEVLDQSKRFEIDKFYHDYVEKGINIVELMDLETCIIIIDDHLKYTIIDKQQEYESSKSTSRLLLEENIDVKENILYITSNDVIRGYSLNNLEIVYKHEIDSEDVRELHIEPDSKQVTYINNNGNLMIDNLEFTNEKEIIVDYDSQIPFKLMNPVFGSNNVILVELVGDYPVGTNLVKIDLLEAKQEILHLDDYMLGHTNYLTSSDKYAVLSSELSCTVVDIIDMKTVRSMDLSIYNEFIPELSHDMEKVLFVNNEDKVVVYDILLNDNTILLDKWNGNFLSWSFDDSKILGNNRVNENTDFFIYDY